ncbi:hypothetical protein BH10ACI1_BH10ACI1_24630 [soil metagenome]
MKRVLVFTIFIVSLLTFANCSSAPVAENTVVDKVKANTNAPNANVTVNTVENGIVAEVPVANTANNTAQTPANAQQKIVNNRLVQSNTNEKPKSSLIPAPNNSSIATTMNERNEFMQIRIFNSDPQIEKLEKNANTQKVRVFLKNGKVLDVPAGQTLDFVNASPQEILIAVGLMKKTDQTQTGAK